MNFAKKIFFVFLMFVLNIPFVKATAGGYSSSTCTQAVVTSVAQGSHTQQIIGIQIVTSGANNTFLQMLTINMTGSTAPTTDAVNIHLYYTGTSNVFSSLNTSEVAGITASAAGSITITATNPQLSNNSTNYFWIAYDVSPTAVVGDLLDAQCTSVLVCKTAAGTGVAETPTVQSPAGSRSIAAPTYVPGGIANYTVWFQANTSVTPTTSGSTITGWASMFNNVSLSQTNSGIGPVYTTSNSGPNFNPAITYTDNSPAGNWAVEALDDHSTSSSDVSYTQQEGFAVQQYSSAMSAQPYVGIVHEYDQDNNDLGRVFATGATQYYSENAGGNDFSDAIGETYRNGVQKLYHNYRWALCRVTKVASTSLLPAFQLGEEDPAHTNSDGSTRRSVGSIAEVVFYPSALTAAKTNQVESYLSIKYGLTLGGDGATTTAYVAPSGTTVWTAATGYHNNVTGIADDNTEGLNQPKSITTGDTLSDVISMANSIYTTPVTMANGTYFIWGHNGLALYAGASASYSSLYTSPVGSKIYTHGGPSTDIYAQIQRVWRTQKTGAPAGNVIVAVDMNQIVGPGGVLGANANADVVLLVDNNTNFGNNGAGEYTISPTAGYSAMGGTVYFSVPYSDFPAVGYFTIASLNQTAAPLPINLLSFTGSCNNSVTTFNWSTASETNNHFFTIQSTEDGINWTNVATIPGSGTTTQTNNYSFTLNQTSGANYYRLSQTDYDGATRYFYTIVVSCTDDSEKSWNIYPNPSNGHFVLQLNGGMEKDVKSIQIYDVLGQNLFSISSINNDVIQAVQNIDLSRFSKGMYFVKVQTQNQAQTKKIVIQ